MPSPAPSRTLTTLRLDPALLALARVAAAVAGKSVNAWINDAIQDQLLREASRDKAGPLAVAMDKGGRP